MTNRLSDSQIADIAKRKYETEQINRVPGVVVDLPSKGLVYPKSSILRDGSLEMRYMTAYDEDILTNKNYIQRGILFDKLIQSVITTSGFNVDELIDADKEWLILMIRMTSYGDEYPVVVTAPDGNSLNSKVNLSRLKFHEFKLQPDDNGEFEYETSAGDTIKYKYNSSIISKNIPDDHAISFTLSNMITQVNDITNKERILDWLKFNFLRKDSAEFRKYANDNAPAVDMTYEFDYVNEKGQKESFRSRFPITSDFFWI